MYIIGFYDVLGSVLKKGAPLSTSWAHIGFQIDFSEGCP